MNNHSVTVLMADITVDKRGLYPPLFSRIESILPTLKLPVYELAVNPLLETLNYICLAASGHRPGASNHSPCCVGVADQRSTATACRSRARTPSIHFALQKNSLHDTDKVCCEQIPPTAGALAAMPLLRFLREQPRRLTDIEGYMRKQEGQDRVQDQEFRRYFGHRLQRCGPPATTVVDLTVTAR